MMEFILLLIPSSAFTLVLNFNLTTSFFFPTAHVIVASHTVYVAAPALLQAEQYCWLQLIYRRCQVGLLSLVQSSLLQASPQTELNSRSG